MIDIIYNQISMFGIMAIFVFMVANGIISGPPSELVLIFGGILATTNNHTLFSVFIAAVAGNLMGACVLYFVGRYYGPRKTLRMLDTLRHRYKDAKISLLLPDRNTALAMLKFIKRKGGIWIGLFRCFPGVRSIVSLPAGAAMMPISLFVFWSLGGICIWASIWMSVGYLLSETWDKFNIYIYLALVACLAVVFYIFELRLKAYVNHLLSSKIIERRKFDA